MTSKDPEPPKRVLVIFSQFLGATHISTVNCDEMAGDRPSQLAYAISALNVDFSSSSPDLLGSRRLLYASVKRGTPLKMVILSILVYLT